MGDAFLIQNIKSGESALSSNFQATGGSITQTTIGGLNYKIHSFTTVGTSNFNVSNLGENPQVEYFIVAGGGGAGGSGADGWNAGGGGGGGILSNIGSPITLTAAGNYTVTVGSGGTRGNSVSSNSGDGNTAGGRGGNSSVFGLTAIGGGGGGAARGFNATGNAAKTQGQSGGNGGGAGVWFNGPTPPGGAGVTGQGNNGGNGSTTGNGFGAAGGGWSGAGASNVTNNNGPAGRTINFRGTNEEFSKGGGTGVNFGATNPTALAANLGHGGTAAYAPSSTVRNGQSGSSGIVVIRYLI